MNLERYEFFARKSHTRFEFVSEGPKGNVKKMVRFTPRNMDGDSYFHLGFGDWNEKNKHIDDLSITDNRDTKKVLATVAAIILAFIERFSDMSVYAIGSTPARTRLYQMGILANWQEIEPLVKVYGNLNNEWQPFRKGVNFEAFFVRKR